MSTHVCVHKHADVCKHIYWLVLSPAFNKTLPSRQGKVTPLLHCISEALTVSFGIPWCLNIGRNLGRPAEGEDGRG